MKVALAQLNPIVGDIDGNAQKILETISRAEESHADLIVFPELVIMGYPPLDLVRRKDLVARNVEALERIAQACTNLTAVVGYVAPDPAGTGTRRFNAAAVCQKGCIVATYQKRLLPTYDVFDEARYFNEGQSVTVFDVHTGSKTHRVGITICEDLWNDRQFDHNEVYAVDPVAQTVKAGAELIINLSGSPFRAGLQEYREKLFSGQAKEQKTPIVYVNQVGGNDELLFDGASLVLDAEGKSRARALSFEEDLLVVDLDDLSTARVESLPSHLEGIHLGLVRGIKDYFNKCGFSGAVIGLSGGIDSALTAALVVEAIGAKQVHGFAMPSRYSSDHSVADARQLAQNLGIAFDVIAIEECHVAMEGLLSHLSTETSGEKDVTAENIQARIRGNILMAISNRTGSLLVTTGNKSELAVGYCTLYGDMCGGLAVLNDVPKTVVYELAKHVNQLQGKPWIPTNSIEKPPSAELRPDQVDQDSLPPYDILDAILVRYVEQDMSENDIIADGFDRDTVKHITKLVRGAEHKRTQAPIGLKVTSRAFGSGRRVPIAARYK